MTYAIKKIPYARGEIRIPGDKSISHRGIMLGALAEGTTSIDGFLEGADCLATIDCFRKLGILIEHNGSRVTVHGRGMHGLHAPKDMLYTGNSGTTTRLLCGLLSGQKFNSRITGDASIQKRPMRRVTAPLAKMGANIQGDYCPLSIIGTPLHGIDYQMPVASAQVKTALLFAGLYADSPTTIYETEKSRDHTELMLEAMGAPIQTEGHSVLIHPTKTLQPQHINVPGDISSAAFFLALGALLPNTQITVQNVGINPTRTGMLDVLRQMNASVKTENTRFSTGEAVADLTASSSSLRPAVIGGALIPRLIDELPILAAMALFADGETVIRDAAELKVKETNRIHAVVEEFKKTGASIEETDDGMIIYGGKPLHGADFKTYGDHRMAMTLTVLAQLLDGPSTLDDAACAEVSYPTFFEDFYGLGE